MIKAVIFDIGGVILNMDDLLPLAVKEFQPMDIKKFWQDINIMAIPLCKDEFSFSEFWQKMAVKYGKNLSNKAVNELWIKDFDKYVRVNPEIEEIIHSLNEYKLAIISNTVSVHWNTIKDNKIFDLFDVIVLSHKVKLTKDQKDIFLLAIKRLGVKADECVFIDDIPAFIKTAESIGMRGILYKNAEQLVKDLGELNIKI